MTYKNDRYIVSCSSSASMRYEFTEKIEIAEEKSVVDIIHSGVIYNRENVEIKRQATSEDRTELVLGYTGHKEKEREENEISIAGSENEIIIDSTIECSGKAPGVKVGFKGVVRNIRSSIAGYSPEYYNKDPIPEA